VLAAIASSQGIGLAATSVILAASGEVVPPPAALGWSAAAGLSGLVGLGFFYLALSRGTMGLVAPLAGLIGAALPAVVAILAGEEVGQTRLAGIVVALVAVVLISMPGRSPTPRERRLARLDLRELPLVVGAGLGFAGFFLLLDRAAAEGAATWWPLFVVRLVGLAMVLGVIAGLLARGRHEPLARRAGRLLGLPRLRALSLSVIGVAPLFALAGAGDTGGNAFFLLANEADTLPVAVVLSSLYPIVTALLAAAFVRERLGGVQLVGIVLAVVGVTLIGLGVSPAV
jgi:drug/metabolite transporter (DMT)-like permease